MLDDLPVTDEREDTLGFAGQVELVVRALLDSDGVPFVVHVAGDWGRGKTSFCKLLERKLNETPSKQVWVEWFIASEHEDDPELWMTFALAKAATKGDPEETQRAITIWARREGSPTGLVCQSFAEWLSTQLGWHNPEAREPATLKLVTPSGEEANYPFTPRIQRMAVVIVDDLDRCSAETLRRTVASIRSMVACRGVCFVVAASSEVLKNALEGNRGALHAFEKYIRHVVHLPGIRDLRLQERQNAARGLQARLFSQDPGVLCPNVPDLRNGIGYLLATYGGSAVTMRRLKRILNDLAPVVAVAADRSGLYTQADLDASWAETSHSTAPSFQETFPTSRRDFPGYFLGRAILEPAKHIWPALYELHRSGERDMASIVASLRSLGATGTWPLDELARVLATLVTEGSSSTPLRARYTYCVYLHHLLAHFSFADAALTAASLDPPALTPVIETDRSIRMQVDEPIVIDSVTAAGKADVVGGLATEHVTGEVSTSHSDSRASREVNRSSTAIEQKPLKPDERPVSALGGPTTLPEHYSTKSMVGNDQSPSILQAIARLTEEARHGSTEPLGEAATLTQMQLASDPATLSQLFDYLGLMVKIAESSSGFSRSTAINLGNLAIDLERLGQGNLARRLHLAIKSHGKFTNDLEGFAHVAQYVSFLLDNPEVLAPSTPMVPNTDVPKEVIDYLNQYRDIVLTSDDAKEARRWRRLAMQAQSRGAAIDFDIEGFLVEQESTILEERTFHAVGEYLLACSYLKKVNVALADKVEGWLSLGGELSDVDPQEKLRIKRGLGDVLASSRGDSERSRARKVYESLRGTLAWTEALLHNLATLYYAADEVLEAGRHWELAWRHGLRDAGTRHSFGVYLRRQGHTSQAALVFTGTDLPAPESWTLFNTPEELERELALVKPELT